MRYTDSHEWIQVEEEIGTIGITDYAQQELGPIVYIELPPVGTSVQLGEEIAVLESTKAATDIYSPVSGKIVAVNQALMTQSHLINSAAESSGWLCKIQLQNLSELDQLLHSPPFRLQEGENADIICPP